MGSSICTYATSIQKRPFSLSILSYTNLSQSAPRTAMMKKTTLLQVSNEGRQPLESSPKSKRALATKKTLVAAYDRAQ